MARRKPLLTIIVSRKASNDLEEIYRYNAEHRGVTPADRWEAYLRSKIASLSGG